MDRSFHRVPFVVQDQNDGVLFIPQHRAKLLDSKLRRAIPRQDNHAPVRAGGLRAKRCGQGVADRSPQRLDDKIHVSRQTKVDRAEGRGALIRKNDVSRTNKCLQRLPEIRLRQRAIRLRVGHRALRRLRGCLVHVLFAQFHQRFDCLKHGDAGKPDVTDAGSVRLNFYRLCRGKLMREAGGQGIGKSRADAQYGIRPFNRLFYRTSARRTAVGAVKTGVTLVKYAFTHQHGGVCHRHVLDPFL